ncbi:MAG: hypothetical protein H7A44_08415 [Opitutaceae bacterium]|nr:hypothetical protein [Cephaloticoccus sp.]MCP5530453.1 hypothetical protein [Opitutaceae bacterium]
MRLPVSDGLAGRRVNTLVRGTVAGIGLLLLTTLVVQGRPGGERLPKRMPLLMPDDFESMKLVSWRVEEGEPDAHNPLLEPAMPWDSGGIMAHGTVLRDPIDGLWKAWQVSTPGEAELDGLRVKVGGQRRLTYLESEDGITWRRPKLSRVHWIDGRRTNILLDLDSGGTAAYASVLVDPENREWPYEMFVLRGPLATAHDRQVGHLPGPRGKVGGYRYRSKNGVDWRLIEGPLDLGGAGGGSFSYIYRDPDGSYAAICKSYSGNEHGDRFIPYDNTPHGSLRRLSLRMSEDGRAWSGETPLLGRDWRDAGYAQFMELCPLRVLGGFVAFVTAYDASNQTTMLQLAASRDGVHWWRPDRRPALPNPPLGDYGGGMIWQMHHPIVDGDRMYVYYAGSEGLHGEIHDTRFGPRIEVGNETVIGMQTPTLPVNSALCRASWRGDRLWALVPSAGGVTWGEAVTRLRERGGGQLVVNARVKPGGELRVGLLDAEGRAIPGYSSDDCVAVTGDVVGHMMHWRGGDTPPNNAVKMHFHMRRTFLYGYDWIKSSSI